MMTYTASDRWVFNWWMDGEFPGLKDQEVPTSLEHGRERHISNQSIHQEPTTNHLYLKEVLNQIVGTLKDEVFGMTILNQYPISILMTLHAINLD